MADSVYRYLVPVDDQWHEVKLTGAILHVAARRRVEVEVWAYHLHGQPARTRRLRVFGTGQPLPDGGVQYIGTAIVPGGALVWHLFERLGRPADGH